jgi:hypothetical protein
MAAPRFALGPPRSHLELFRRDLIDAEDRSEIISGERHPVQVSIATVLLVAWEGRHKPGFLRPLPEIRVCVSDSRIARCSWQGRHTPLLTASIP